MSDTEEMTVGLGFNSNTQKLCKTLDLMSFEESVQSGIDLLTVAILMLVNEGVTLGSIKGLVGQIEPICQKRMDRMNADE